MLDPLTLSLLISGGSSLLGWATHKDPKNRLAGIQFPTQDYGAMQRARMSQIGSDVTAAGRAGERSMASQGLQDTGQQYQMGQGLAGEGMRAGMQSAADIEQMKNRDRIAYLNFLITQGQNQQNLDLQNKDAWDYLGGGAQMFSSLYPMLNPQAFMPQFPQTGQQGQGGTPAGGGMFGMGQMGQRNPLSFNSFPQYGGR